MDICERSMDNPPRNIKVLQGSQSIGAHIPSAVAVIFFMVLINKTIVYYINCRVILLSLDCLRNTQPLPTFLKIKTIFLHHGSTWFLKCIRSTTIINMARIVGLQFSTNLDQFFRHLCGDAL